MASEKSRFEELNEERRPSLAREFLVFMIENKAWWMLPIIIILGLMSLLVVLAGTGAAPFIYPLF